MGKDAVATVLLHLEVSSHHQQDVLIDVFIVFGQRSGEVYQSFLDARAHHGYLGVSLILHTIIIQVIAA